MSKETIFVQIASYRDPELVKTLDDLFDKAKNPDNLHVCVAFQFSEEDTFTKDINKYRDDSRLTIIDIPYTASKGACWARNKIQQEYKQEQYTLQLDSHHRFTQDWDITCINMLKGLQSRGYDKPLLTSYIPSYNPQTDPKGRVDTPWGMSFDRFTPEGVVFFMPYYMERMKLHPEPARFFSAHFCFTLGQFSEEVQHDPEYYFHGEEITLAVRAYTHGYDLFHPNKVIAWHEYTRNGRVKQWDDDKEWGNRNTFTHKKVRSLLGVDGENEIKEEKYGLGTVRTLEDYEIYAGVRFKDRAITKATKNNVPPPGDKQDTFYQEFKEAIGLHHSQFSDTDYDFCALIFEDEKGEQLHRKDLPGKLVNQKLKESKEGKEWVEWVTYTGPKPNKIIIWPSSKANGWVDKREINL